MKVGPELSSTAESLTIEPDRKGIYAMSFETGIVTDANVHQMMREQMLKVLADSDMTEEQKQQVLVAMSCPCCGGSGMALTIPLDGSKPVF